MNFFFVDFNPIYATTFATYRQSFEFFCQNNIFLAFVKTFFLKTLDTQNILATTERVSIGASLRIIKIGF
jgi:hypothetical protein